MLISIEGPEDSAINDLIRSLCNNRLFSPLLPPSCLRSNALCHLVSRLLFFTSVQSHVHLDDRTPYLLHNHAESDLHVALPQLVSIGCVTEDEASVYRSMYKIFRDRNMLPYVHVRIFLNTTLDVLFERMLTRLRNGSDNGCRNIRHLREEIAQWDRYYDNKIMSVSDALNNRRPVRDSDLHCDHRAILRCNGNFELGGPCIDKLIADIVHLLSPYL